jgi:glycosyltransferase involved in cell wall biosynthesis
VSRPLRIAWLGHQSSRAGDGLITYSRETVNALRARGLDVVFVHHGQPPDGRRDEVALRSLTGSHRYIISSPRTRRTISELIRDDLIDVVHISLSFSTSVDFRLPELCHELGVPAVATFHVPYDSRLSLWQGISKTIYRVYAQSLAAYDRVVIFSEQQKALLTQVGVPAERIEVVHNGVDVEKYRPGPSAVKPRLGAQTLVGYLGRIDPEKNVEALTRAFVDLDPAPQTHLLIVGHGSDRRRLERRFAGRQVHFAGQVADEAQRISMLRAMDVFVLPSAVEGLSLSLLEAMACGVPTVATDVGSDGEAIEGAGLVLEPRELDGQLRLALRTLLEFPRFRAELGRRARARVLERYSLEQTIDRLLAIYSELSGYAGLPALVNR